MSKVMHEFPSSALTSIHVNKTAILAFRFPAIRLKERSQRSAENAALRCIGKKPAATVWQRELRNEFMHPPPPEYLFR
jgi:hypothetical protein